MISRLAQLLAGDANGAEGHLLMGEHRQLVSLDVRPKLETMQIAVFLQGT